jgi:hypothetical protein
MPVLGHAADPGVVTSRLAEVSVHRHCAVRAPYEVRSPGVQDVIAALTGSAAPQDSGRGLLHEGGASLPTDGHVRGVSRTVVR